jgi:hypothetical protein
MPAEVHPAASYVASLLSDMSLIDQLWSFSVGQRILTASAVLAFPVAYTIQSFRICAYAIAAALVLVLGLGLPNWRQRSDPSAFVSEEIVDAYYTALEAARSAKGGDATSAAAAVGGSPVRTPSTKITAASVAKAGKVNPK